MKTAPPRLDELDRRIVEVLTVDARVSNRRIAAQLGVTEGTIRGRINRLEDTTGSSGRWVRRLPPCPRSGASS